MKDLYYTAGLIDGEGTISMAPPRKGEKFRSPLVSCSSTTYSIVEYLQTKYGGTICKQKKQKEHHKQSWSWRIMNDRAIKFCMTIHDILLEPDKARRAKLLAFKYKTVTVRNGQYNEEQLSKKYSFQEEFFHPSTP